MNELLAALQRLFGQIIFWAMIEPWEQAIRVRAGKHVRRLKPGFHLRIPILDVIHKQTVRRRASMMPTQTLSTADGHTLVVGASLNYIISDIELLYRNLHHGEDTLVQIAAGALAANVLATARVALSPAKVSEAVNARLAGEMEALGFGGVRVCITDFAFVRAFRLVQDYRFANGKPLSVEGAQS